MNTQHTPGPWTVRQGEYNFTYKVYAEKGDPEQDKANIRLVAAAPELLEAARKAHWFHELEAKRASVDGRPAAFKMHLVLAEKLGYAISKAIEVES